MDVNTCSNFISFSEKASELISQTREGLSAQKLLSFFLNNQRYLSVNQSKEANETLYSIYERVSRECPCQVGDKIKLLMNAGDLVIEDDDKRDLLLTPNRDFSGNLAIDSKESQVVPLDDELFQFIPKAVEKSTLEKYTND